MSPSREGPDTEFVESIRGILRKAFWAGNPGEPEPPETLYHYSAPAGLAGIVQSKGIWATDFRFTNDSEELTTGEKTILQGVGDAATSAPNDDARVLLNRLRRSLEEKAPTSEESLRFFVASFTENGNQLSQWRAYGADGAGYSLGFRRSALKEIAEYPKPDRPGAIYILRCGYEAK